MTACEVWPGVFVGDLAAAHFFQGPKLCVRDQKTDYMFRAMGDKQVYFVYGRPPKRTFEDAAAWLDVWTAERNHPPILVHCSGGLHRSAAVVVYWLWTRKNMSITQAYEHIRLMRPEIEPRESWIVGKTSNPTEENEA